MKMLEIATCLEESEFSLPMHDDPKLSAAPLNFKNELFDSTFKSAIEEIIHHGENVELHLRQLRILLDIFFEMKAQMKLKPYKNQPMPSLYDLIDEELAKCE